jgi:hypothetical protein
MVNISAELRTLILCADDRRTFIFAIYKFSNKVMKKPLEVTARDKDCAHIGVTGFLLSRIVLYFPPTLIR